MGRSHMSTIYTIFVVFGLIVATCNATTYTIGDSSGWDISTDLDTWQEGKHFVVGDILSFQYSNSDTVNEVTKYNYDGCNTTNYIQTFSSGNTTIPITKPGDRYFVSGNKLYCLGGMKLHVHVDGTMSPAGAPEAESGADFPSSNPSSKSNNPASIVPNTAVVKVVPNTAVVKGGEFMRSLVFPILGFVSAFVFVI